jgi:hypothetical protein
MTEIELLIEREQLRGDAAAVAGLILTADGSAKADAYAAEHRVAERLAAFRAAGGVL